MYDPPGMFGADPLPHQGPVDWYGETFRHTPDDLNRRRDGFPPAGPGDDFGVVSPDWDEELTLLLRAVPSPVTAAAPVAHVHVPSRPQGRRRVHRTRTPRKMPGGTRLLSAVLAMMTAFVMTAVGMLSALISYDPLRYLALVGVPDGLARGWPFLVFGPWLAACLSIIRASMYRRQATHAWLIVLCFTGIAMILCVAHSSRTVSGVAVAAIPPLAALACFHQFIRQTTLNHPPRHARRRPAAARPTRPGPDGVPGARRTTP
ncbi:DUF2637 domain-containing protein [Streptomyces sp. CAU 1734]|uniref:DUF2637 domain-containing protein n=1 Tax=Streptomyces sp. CAU 1734 TaxID=3140360 RepID=UPI0032603F57